MPRQLIPLVMSRRSGDGGKGWMGGSLLLECVAGESRQGPDLLVFSGREWTGNEKGETRIRTKGSAALLHSLSLVLRVWSASFATTACPHRYQRSEKLIHGSKKQGHDSVDGLCGVRDKSRSKGTKERTGGGRSIPRVIVNRREKRGAFSSPKTPCIPPDTRREKGKE